MATFRHSISRFAIWSLFSLICALSSYSQVPGDVFRRTLVERAGFTDEELAKASDGEPIVKTLKNSDKKDFGVCGIVRIRSTKDVTMAAFREAVSRRGDKTILAQSDFSSPPAAADLAQLTLDPADIDALKECEVGDCKLKLSAALIKRFHSEIEWNADDHADRANDLFREILSQYIAGYATSGERSLMQYDNQSRPVDLAVEQRILLARSLFVGEIAPEFVKYLTEYPGAQLPAVDNNLHWTKIGFGLEPLVAVTHSSLYTRPDGLFIATRQIYASRYVEASLAFSMLVTVSLDGSNERYVIFTNLSRSDSLGGLLGGLKRSVVGADVAERTVELLNHAKGRLDRPDVPPANEPDQTLIERITEFVGERFKSILAIALAGILLLGLLFIGRKG